MENHPSGSQDFQTWGLAQVFSWFMTPPPVLDNLVCYHPVWWLCWTPPISFLPIQYYLWLTHQPLACCLSAGYRIHFREHTGQKPQQVYGERNSLRLCFWRTLWAWWVITQAFTSLREQPVIVTSLTPSSHLHKVRLLCSSVSPAQSRYSLPICRINEALHLTKDQGFFFIIVLCWQ